jgi:transposase
MQVITIGLDIAKSAFQVHGADRQGRAVLKRKLTRSKVLVFFANLPPCLVGLEACGGAHFWARQLNRLGHEVRLMAPQYVKAYVKTNKHDAADAEAICEAVQRPGMRYVAVKDEHQQAMLMLHRIRDRLVAERTAAINAIRGHMTEFGMVAAKGHVGMVEIRSTIADPDDARLTPLARELLTLAVGHLQSLEEKIAELDTRVGHLAREDANCRRLIEIPGVGPIVATGVLAAAGDLRLFDSGRSFAAWLGLTPRQHSTGGKQRLLGISKRGDGYLRRQIMHGARSIVSLASSREGKLWTRIPQMDWCSASPVHQFWLKNQDLTLDQGSRVLTDATGERGNP